MEHVLVNKLTQQSKVMKVSSNLEKQQYLIESISLFMS